jgi:hypothetical protein
MLFMEEDCKYNCLVALRITFVSDAPNVLVARSVVDARIGIRKLELFEFRVTLINSDGNSV